MRSFQDGDFWNKEIVNWKNKQGNTVLHIAATLNQSLVHLLSPNQKIFFSFLLFFFCVCINSVRSIYQAIKQLMKTCICLNNKNSDGLTAMEVLGDQALVISHRDKTKIQRLSRRKLHLPTARMNLRSPTLFVQMFEYKFLASQRFPTNHHVFPTLIATVTYKQH